MLDSDLKVLRADDLPGILRQIPQTFGITNEKAVVLILSLHALVKEYIAHDEETIAGRFPDEFDKKLMKLMFKMMREISD